MEFNKSLFLLFRFKISIELHHNFVSKNHYYIFMDFNKFFAYEKRDFPEM